MSRAAEQRPGQPASMAKTEHCNWVRELKKEPNLKTEDENRNTRTIVGRPCGTVNKQGEQGQFARRRRCCAGTSVEEERCSSEEKYVPLWSMCWAWQRIKAVKVFLGRGGGTSWHVSLLRCSFSPETAQQQVEPECAGSQKQSDAEAERCASPPTPRGGSQALAAGEW